MRFNFNLAIATIAIVFPMIFIPIALQLPPARTPGLLGPGHWPLAILILMFILGIALLIKEYKETRKRKAEGEIKVEEEPKKDVIGPKIAYPNRYWYIVLILFLYTLFLPYVGFVVATPLLIFATAWVLGMRRLPYLILLTLISTALIIYIFPILLGVPVPRGMGIFREFSFWFY